MSRVGNAPILIPAGVTVEKTDNSVVVKGPKGELSMEVDPAITVIIEESQVIFKRKNEEKKNKALHGLTRALINNMVLGVTNGWSKNLELVGVGYRAQGSGNKLTLSVGYSHPIEISAPDQIQFEVSDNTKIKVSGIDKQLVGAIAAKIKSVRPPEPYKGKGIRYEGEYIRRKAGKAGKIGVAGTAK